MYLVDFASFFAGRRCGKDWQSPCSVKEMRVAETRNAFGGARREEGLMK